MTDVHDIVVRLKEEAKRMAPDSQGRLLLREAAFTIERLDEEVRRRTGHAAPAAAAVAQEAL